MGGRILSTFKRNKRKENCAAQKLSNVWAPPFPLDAPNNRKAGRNHPWPAITHIPASAREARRENWQNTIMGVKSTGGAAEIKSGIHRAWQNKLTNKDSSKEPRLQIYLEKVF